MDSAKCLAGQVNFENSALKGLNVDGLEKMSVILYELTCITYPIICSPIFSQSEGLDFLIEGQTLIISRLLYLKDNTWKDRQT